MDGEVAGWLILHVYASAQDTDGTSRKLAMQKEQEVYQISTVQPLFLFLFLRCCRFCIDKQCIIELY